MDVPSRELTLAGPELYMSSRGIGSGHHRHDAFVVIEIQDSQAVGLIRLLLERITGVFPEYRRRIPGLLLPIVVKQDECRA
jgi:hypothetical protein